MSKISSKNLLKQMHANVSIYNTNEIWVDENNNKIYIDRKPIDYKAIANNERGNKNAR